jgi:hypothetical protein
MEFHNDIDRYLNRLNYLKSLSHHDLLKDEYKNEIQKAIDPNQINQKKKKMKQIQFCNQNLLNKYELHRVVNEEINLLLSSSTSTPTTTPSSSSSSPSGATSSSSSSSSPSVQSNSMRTLRSRRPSTLTSSYNSKHSDIPLVCPMISSVPAYGTDVIQKYFESVGMEFYEVRKKN